MIWPTACPVTYFSLPPTFSSSMLHTNWTAFWICLAHNFQYVEMSFTPGISYSESIQTSNANSLSNSCFAYTAANKTECRQHHIYTSYETCTFSLVLDSLPHHKEIPKNSIQISVTSVFPGWPTNVGPKQALKLGLGNQMETPVIDQTLWSCVIIPFHLYLTPLRSVFLS